MKVYISGKITGLSYLEAFQNFARIEQYLRKIGVEEIFNPMVEVDQTLPYRDQMSICLESVRKCDVIILQHNWIESPGSREEITEAQKYKLHIRYDRPGDYRDIERMLGKAFVPA